AERPGPDRTENLRGIGPRPGADRRRARPEVPRGDPGRRAPGLYGARAGSGLRPVDPRSLLASLAALGRRSLVLVLEGLVWRKTDEFAQAAVRPRGRGEIRGRAEDGRGNRPPGHGQGKAQAGKGGGGREREGPRQRGGEAARSTGRGPDPLR